MVDLHTHVLPGIDDGPPDLAGSVEMVAAADRAGVEIVVATPHLREDHPEVRADELPARVADLGEELRAFGIGVKVLAGAELAVTTAIDMSDSELRAVTLGANGRDLLVETPYAPLTEMFYEVIDDLLARGFRITLAHPERSSTLQEDGRQVASLVDRGLFMQVTGSSLARGRKSRARRLALSLISKRWCHVLASDSHGVAVHRPDLRQSVRLAERLRAAPPAELRWLARDAPLAIVTGEELPPRPVVKTRRLSLARRP